MSDFKRNLPPKNALSEYKLTLSCKPVEGSNRPGNLKFTIVKNNPRIDVYTNSPNDKDNGLIRAAMDAPACYALLQMLAEVIDGPADNKYKMNNYNYTFYDGKRSDEPKLISTTHVGKDKKGVVYIAVTAKDRPFLKFNFLPSIYHTLIKSDGTEMDQAEASVIYAKGMLTLLTNLIANVLDSTYVEPESNDNGNKNNNSKSSKSQSTSSSNWDEDDFPM